MMNVNEISCSRGNILEGAEEDSSEDITNSMEQVIKELLVVNFVKQFPVFY
jgi:hypothetical protein